jgi:enamine deaminase RidA (YjgF/YER057c/UK114 family)
MSSKTINPTALGSPRGYSNGILVDGNGKLLFIAGQIAWNEHQQIVSDSFVEQFDRALANVISVLTEAGGNPTNITRLGIYVTNKAEYLASTKEVGQRYQKHMGKHYPAMILLEVKGLLDDSAKVEIEAIAVLT